MCGLRDCRVKSGITVGGGMVYHSKCLACYAFPPPEVAGGGLVPLSSFSRIFFRDGRNTFPSCSFKGDSTPRGCVSGGGSGKIGALRFKSISIFLLWENCWDFEDA